MKGLKENLTTTLKDRVTDYRDRFVRIFYSRYLELLPTLITYENTDKVSIDFLKVEVALMNNHAVVIGENSKGIIQVLGFLTSDQTSENPTDLFNDGLISKKDINFTIPDYLIPDEMREINHYNDCRTGNFVVIRNKTLNYTSDTEIIQHYTISLAEVVLSRFSLTMQAKIITFFLGDENDESINNLVNDLYNGSPIVKAGKFFDPNEHIYHMQSDNISQNFNELKREYQNIIGELNNMLGINSLAVEKTSGVSDVEAKSNRSFITSVANIKLESRNHALKKLNKRYNLDLKAIYNDEVASELSDMAYKEGDENS